MAQAYAMLRMYTCMPHTHVGRTRARMNAQAARTAHNTWHTARATLRYGGMAARIDGTGTTTVWGWVAKGVASSARGRRDRVDRREGALGLSPIAYTLMAYIVIVYVAIA